MGERQLKFGKPFLRTNDYKFVYKNKKTQIVNNTGTIVAEIEVSSRAFIENEILYDWNENRFIAIDLSKLIKKSTIK